MEAEWGTPEQWLAADQRAGFWDYLFRREIISPGMRKRSDFICLRTFMPMETVNVCHKAFLDAAFNKLPAISEW